MFLCLLPAGAVRSQICEVEFGYNYFTTFRRHVILQVLKPFTIRDKILKFGLLFIHMPGPVTIEMFDKV